MLVNKIYIVGPITDEALLMNPKNEKNSPLLEMYNEKNIEVLIMDQDIDEFIIPSVSKYKDFSLKSVNVSDAADDKEEETE